MKEKNNDFLIVCIIYFAAYLILAFLRVASYLEWTSGSVWRIILPIFLQGGVMFVFPLFCMIWYKKRTQAKPLPDMSFAEYMDMKARPAQTNVMKSWGFGKVSWRVMGFAFLLGILLLIFNMYVSSFFNGILAFAGYRHMGGGGDSAYASLGFLGLLITLFFGSVLPGFCEEVTHRGMLLRGFRDRIGIMRAIMLSSILFGLFHMSAVQVFYCIILGYFICLAVVITRSIWTGIIIHFMNNAVSDISSFARTKGWTGADFITHIVNFLGGVGMILYAFIFIGVFYLIIWILTICARDNFMKDQAARVANGLEPIQIPKQAKGMDAIRFYLTAGETTKPIRSIFDLRPLEKTFLFGLIFLGVIINVMSIVWGFL